jgi:hypothetical protein
LALWLTDEAAAEPAIPSESAEAAAMTAIALNFTVSSRSGARLASTSGELPRCATTVVEAELNALEACETVI